VVVFGRTPAKLHAFADKFGYAATTDLSSIYDDPAIELVDVPDRLGLHRHGRLAQQPGHDRGRAGPTRVADHSGRDQGQRRVRSRGPARLPERDCALWRLGAAAQALWDARWLPGGVHRRRHRAAGPPATTAAPPPLLEYTEQGEREIGLRTRDAYAAVIDHVIACCQDRDSSRLSPASVLDTLQLTLEVRAALTAAKRP
jgi:hypothetical protein